MSYFLFGSFDSDSTRESMQPVKTFAKGRGVNILFGEETVFYDEIERSFRAKGLHTERDGRRPASAGEGRLDSLMHLPNYRITKIFDPTVTKQPVRGHIG